ncbi:MAG: hypothetical protein ACM3H7_06910, partial [Acidobacteriaceae bacterium]
MRKKILISIFVLQVIIGGLALAFIISSLWHKPLGPSLGSSSAPSGQESGPGLAASPVPGITSPVDSAQEPKSLLDKLKDLIAPDA